VQYIDKRDPIARLEQEKLLQRHRLRLEEIDRMGLASKAIEEHDIQKQINRNKQKASEFKST
jgi:hypothetical protein